MEQGIDQLRHPVPSLLDEALKQCLAERTDLAGRVLSGAEMSEYVLWMVESYGSGNAGDSADILTPIMSQGDISDIGSAILADPRDPATRQRLAALYEDAFETSFFQNAHDISAGIFLRHLPPYWREDDYFEVYYAFSGTSPVFFENEVVRLSHGDVLLVPPGIRKACTLPDDNCSVLFFMIRKSTFSQVFLAHLSERNLMSKFFRDALGGSRDVTYLLFSTGGDDWIENLLYRIFEECRRDGTYSSRLANALMSSFFLSLLQGYEDTARVPSQSGMHWKPGFADMLRFVQQNYATVTLREVAERFGYSERQVMRIIYDSTGERFSQLQTRLRMQGAARMLLAGSTALQAAEAAGFSDPSSFYRAFTRYHGCTTRQYVDRNSTRLPDRASSL